MNLVAASDSHAALLQDLAFQYDTAGNLLDRNDRLHGEERSFEYDAREQLRTERRAGDVVRAYRYDTLGNMSWSSDVGTLTHGLTAGPAAARRLVHAVVESPSGRYGYDDAGRMVSGPNGRKLEWMSLGLPSRVEDEEAQEDLEYDAYGRRVWSRANDLVTTRMDGLYEHRQRLGEEDVDVYHVFAGGHEVARVEQERASPASAMSVHADEMGSLALLVDEGGTVTARRAYEPFGRRRDEPWTVTTGALVTQPQTGFTGHSHDDAVGLIDMNARLYDPALRHFISPDPIIANEASPATYNAYAYVEQNPFKWTDPTGMEATSGVEQGTVQSGDVTFYINGRVRGGADDVSGQAPSTPADGATGSIGGVSPNVHQGHPAQRQSVGEQDFFGRHAQTLDNISNGVAGFGNFISFGFTGWVNGHAGNQADESSSAYQWGERAGVAFALVDVAASLPSLVRLAAQVPRAVGRGVELARAAAAGIPRLLRRAPEVAEEVVELGEASRATAAARELGQAGEAAAGIVKNRSHIPSLTGTARFWIPDVLNRSARLIGEVKNVRRLSFTRQLRDFAAFATRHNFRFELIVREGTRLSRPLQRAVDAGDIILLRTLP